MAGVLMHAPDPLVGDAKKDLSRMSGIQPVQPSGSGGWMSALEDRRRSIERQLW
jgi:hypothetical protein